MKIVIEHKTTKRIIDGPFNICGSRSDLEHIINKLEKAVDSDFCYGWVKINFDQESIANTAPIPWE